MDLPAQHTEQYGPRPALFTLPPEVVNVIFEVSSIIDILRLRLSCKTIKTLIDAMDHRACGNLLPVSELRRIVQGPDQRPYNFRRVQDYYRAALAKQWTEKKHMPGHVYFAPGGTTLVYEADESYHTSIWMYDADMRPTRGFSFVVGERSLLFYDRVNFASIRESLSLWNAQSSKRVGVARNVETSGYVCRLAQLTSSLIAVTRQPHQPGRNLKPNVLILKVPNPSLEEHLTELTILHELALEDYEEGGESLQPQVRVSPAQGWLAVIAGRTVCVWTIRDLEHLPSNQQARPRCSTTLPSTITMATFHPNRELLQVVDDAQNLRAVHLTDGSVVDWHINRRDFTAAMSKKVEMQYDPSGKYLMLHSGTHRSTLILEERSLLSPSRRSFEPLLKIVSDSACFSPSGPFLWSANFEDQRLTLQRLDGMILMADVALNTQWPLGGSLRISPDGRVVSILDRNDVARVSYISSDAMEPNRHATYS